MPPMRTCGGGGGAEGQVQDEGGALAGVAFHLGPAAVQFDQRLDQGQAHARTAALAPHEAVKDVGLQVIGDAASGVGDRQAHFRRRRLGGQGDGTAFGYGAGRVFQ